MKKLYIIFVFINFLAFADNICKNSDILYEHFGCQKVERALFENDVKDYLIPKYTSVLVNCTTGLLTTCNSKNKYYNRSKIANNYTLENFSSIADVESLNDSLGREESQSKLYRLDYQAANATYNQNLLNYKQENKKYLKHLASYKKQQDLIKRYNSLNYQKCLRGEITNSYGNPYPAIACEAIGQSWTLVDTIPRNKIKLLQEPTPPVEPKFEFPDYNNVSY